MVRLFAAFALSAAAVSGLLGAARAASLVAGGIFPVQLDFRTTRNVAVLNGSNWDSLGERIPLDPGYVYALSEVVLAESDDGKGKCEREAESAEEEGGRGASEEEGKGREGRRAVEQRSEGY